MSALWIERLWPYAVGIAVLGVWYWLSSPFPAKPDALMGASGTVAAVLVGFLGTAKAIILTITRSAIFRKLKEAGYTAILFRYLYEAILFGSVFLVVSVVGFFLPENEPQKWFAIIWILTGSWALLLYLRSTALLFKLVRHA